MSDGLTAAVNDKLPSIFLIRHAAPDFDTKMRTSGHHLSGAVGRYDAADLESSTEAVRSVQIDRVYCSDLQRSTQSASALFPLARVSPSTLYREAELPVRFPGWMTLSFLQWLTVARCAWFLGYAQNVENLSAARSRATDAASQLIAHANAESIAILVGHGVFNHLVGSPLRKQRWEKRYSDGLGYGSWQTYGATNDSV